MKTLGWSEVYDGKCPTCGHTYCHGMPFLTEEGKTKGTSSSRLICCFLCLANLLGTRPSHLVTMAFRKVLRKANPDLDEQLFKKDMECLGFRYDDGTDQYA